MHTAARFLVALVPLGLAATGCPLPPVARPYPPPTADELYGTLQSRLGAVKTQRTETRVDYLAGRDGRVKLRITFLTQGPDRLRMEAESPFGGSVASLASDGAQFEFLDVRNNRFLAGAAEPCNIARLIRIALRPSDVVAVLDGAAPVIESAPDARTVGWDPRQGGREVLTLRGADGSTETVKFDARGHQWDVVEAELRDAGGRLSWRVEHGGYSTAEGSSLRLPGQSRITQPARGADAEIKYKSRELDVTPPEGAFQLAPPPGIPAENVRCDG